jgi:hypothetical protein
MKHRSGVQLVLENRYDRSCPGLAELGSIGGMDGKRQRWKKSDKIKAYP